MTGLAAAALTAGQPAWMVDLTAERGPACRPTGEGRSKGGRAPEPCRSLDFFERRARVVRVPVMDSIPIGQPMTGNMTWYDTPGYGACGEEIDPATQDLVAVSSR